MATKKTPPKAKPAAKKAPPAKKAAPVKRERAKPSINTKDEVNLTESEEQYCVYVAMGYTQVESYLKAFEGARSWKRTAVYVKASELSAMQKIKVRVVELKKQNASNSIVTIERILLEMARVAFFDPRMLLDEQGNPIPLAQLDDDVAAAIASYEVETTSATKDKTTQLHKVRTVDKRGALEMLARTKSMFNDKLKLQANVTLDVVDDLRQFLAGGSRLPISGEN